MSKSSKNSIVGLKELRENMDSYIKRVDSGESFTVVKRSKPIFKLSPIDDEELGWDTVIDFTEINPRGVPAQDVLQAIRSLDG